MLRSIPFSYVGLTPDGVKCSISLDVVRAGLIQVLRHDRLVYEGNDLFYPKDPSTAALPYDPDLFSARVYIYPCCIGGSENVEIRLDGDLVSWPLSFDLFSMLPPDGIDKWISLIYSQNPRWEGKKAETTEEDLEKKVTASTNDSSTSSQGKRPSEKKTPSSPKS